MIDGPRPEERACFEVVRRVTGHSVEHYDIPGRDKVVDGLLTYADGRRAAIEVTTECARERQQHLDALLAREPPWPLPDGCEWRWLVSVRDVQNLPLARAIFPRVVKLCERHGVSRPDRLPNEAVADDADVLAFLESSVTFHGLPTLTPKVVGGRKVALVWQVGVAGFPAPGLDRLNDELAELFRVPNIGKHLDKVCSFDADERHLMIVLHVTALSFSLTCELMNGDSLPSQPPRGLPAQLTHLWLLPEFTRRVLLWSPAGWSQHQLSDA